MSAAQRIPCVALVPEAQRLPAVFHVAGLASCTIAPLMTAGTIVGGVATGAGNRGSRPELRVAVALLATRLPVAATEVEARIAIVVEPTRFPSRFRMARRAFLAQCAFVHVILAMAGLAGCRQFVVMQRATVTRIASHDPMAIAEREMRVTIVLKRRCLPVGGIVAAAAADAKAPLVGVVLAMAAQAVEWRVGERLVDVAAPARRACMALQQRETGLRVMKRGRAPGIGVVTARAIGPQARAMHVVLAVAGGAIGRCVPMACAGTMAAGAGRGGMAAAQDKVAGGVIEPLLVELHDLRVPPPVLGMAGSALALRDATMVAGALPNIARHGFVAIETEARLRRSVEAHVTPAAVGLDLGVSLDDLAGHQRGLQPLAVRRRVTDNGGERNEHGRRAGDGLNTRERPRHGRRL